MLYNATKNHTPKRVRPTNLNLTIKNINTNQDPIPDISINTRDELQKPDLLLIKQAKLFLNTNFQDTNLRSYNPSPRLSHTKDKKNTRIIVSHPVSPKSPKLGSEFLLNNEKKSNIEYDGIQSLSLKSPYKPRSKVTLFEDLTLENGNFALKNSLFIKPIFSKVDPTKNERLIPNEKMEHISNINQSGACIPSSMEFLNKNHKSPKTKKPILSMDDVFSSVQSSANLNSILVENLLYKERKKHEKIKKNELFLNCGSHITKTYITNNNHHTPSSIKSQNLEFKINLPFANPKKIQDMQFQKENQSSS